MKAYKADDCVQLIRKSVNVPMTTLDEYISQQKIAQIDILKIDTEGFEAMVLYGAQASLKAELFKLIEIELTIDERFGSAGNFYDIEKYLIPNNYTIIAFDDLYSCVTRPIFHLNILYAHRSLLN